MDRCRRALPVVVLLAAPALAQQSSPVLTQRDWLGGGELLETFSAALVGEDGEWTALVNSVPSELRVLVSSGGGIFARDGDLLASPAARVARIGAIAGGNHNLAVFARLDQFTPPRPQEEQALLRNGRVILMTNEPVDAAGIAPGTLCRTIRNFGANASDTVVALVEIAPLQHALVRMTFDAAGNPVSRTADLQVGQALADGALVASIDTSEAAELAQSVNEGGDWIWRVTGNDGLERLVTRDRVLLRQGDPSPVPGRTIAAVRPTSVAAHCFDLDDRGGYAAIVRLSGDTASNLLLIRDGEKLAQERDLVGSIGPYRLDLQPSGVRIADDGHVFWVSLTDDPSGTDYALMRDLDVLVQPGVTRIDDRLVTAIVQSGLEVSASGRFLATRLHLAGERTLVRMDLGSAVPFDGCAPLPGSLRLREGFVLAGAPLELVLDAPAPIGSLAFLNAALGEATPGNPCGVPTPNGEVLIGPARLPRVFAGTYAGAPLEVDVALPATPALVGVELFAQASFLSSPGAVRTNGLRLVIGAP